MMTDKDEIIRDEGDSAVPFWLMMAFLLLWQGAVSILPELHPVQVILCGAGFIGAAVAAFSGAVDTRRQGTGFCVAAVTAFTLWYVSRTVSHFAMIWGGLRIYDGVLAVESACDVLSLETLWPWAVIAFAGLVCSGRLRVTPGRMAIAASILLAVSAAALVYLLGTPEGQLDFADTYLISRLCTQWLLRLGMLCALWAWQAGRVRGVAAWAVIALPAVLSCGIYALCAVGFAASAIFWANAAVCVTFALVGIEYTFMKVRSETP